MTDTWQSLGSITERIVNKLVFVPFEVRLHHSLAKAVKLEAEKSGYTPETIIAEAVRFYIGDAA